MYVMVNKAYALCSVVGCGSCWPGPVIGNDCFWNQCTP